MQTAARGQIGGPTERLRKDFLQSYQLDETECLWVILDKHIDITLLACLVSRRRAKNIKRGSAQA